MTTWYDPALAPKTIRALDDAIAAKDSEIARLRATIDASIRILSDEKAPLQSRVNDARGILARC